MIYFANPKSEYIFLKKKINKKINDVLNSNSYILGNEVRQFENRFSKYLGLKYAVGVSNGTDALILSLKAVNIKKGDEVITTSHTAYATIAAIVEAGAKPVFVDIKEDDFNMNSAELKKKITKKTRAIIIVHIYGNPADIVEISKVAKKIRFILLKTAPKRMELNLTKKRLAHSEICHVLVFIQRKIYQLLEMRELFVLKIKKCSKK